MYCSLQSSLPLKKRKIKVHFHPRTPCKHHFEPALYLSNSELVAKPMYEPPKSIPAVSRPQDSSNAQILRIRKAQSSNHPKKYCTWASKFWELVEFRNRVGHCNVPQKYSLNPALGKWVHKQRQDFKKAKGDPKSQHMLKRFKALLEIGFEVETNNRAEALWHQRFKELQDYRRREGHCDVPQAYELNMRLGKWVRRQRHEYTRMSKGLQCTLTPHRIEALETIGLKWSMRDKRVF